MAPLLRISIGIVVERSKANSPWCEFIWRPIAVLGGIPDLIHERSLRAKKKP
jgi:hypothetical protein